MSDERIIFSPRDLADRVSNSSTFTIATGLHAEYSEAENILRISDAYEGTFIEAKPYGEHGEWNLSVWNVSQTFYPHDTGDHTTDLGYAIKSNGHPDGEAFYFASLVYQAEHPIPARVCRVPALKNESYKFVSTISIDDAIDSILDEAVGREWHHDDDWWIFRAMKRGQVRDQHLPKKPT